MLSREPIRKPQALNLEALFYWPAAMLLGLVVAYPILRTTVLSFTQMSLHTAFQPEFTGAQNYLRLAFDSRFHNSLKITALPPMAAQIWTFWEANRAN